ncbi:MAG TPA: CPBP family intramembrane glutamic endopeptidase [Nocardioides sp.]
MSTVVEPPSGLAYYQVQRSGRSGWGRPLIGLILIGLCVFFVSPAVVLAAFEVFFVLAGDDVSNGMVRVADVENVTPESLAFLLLSLAGAIPAAMLLCWGLHGLRPGWLASVERRIRWRWLLQCLGIAAITMVVTVIIASRLPIPGEDLGASTLNPWTSTMRDFVLVIVLLTPLQAAGEEYLFRGYIFQTFGSLFGGMLGARTVSVTITALLFAFAHGSQDLPLFLDRFAFGIVAGICVIATGGIEAGIAMHVLNNFVSLGMAVAFGDISTVLNTTEGSWWRIPVTLVQSGVFLALTVWAARSAGLSTTTKTP